MDGMFFFSVFFRQKESRLSIRLKAVLHKGVGEGPIHFARTNHDYLPRAVYED